MAIRGVRGAIDVEADTPEIILGATRKLLASVLEANPGMDPADVASIFFTATTDLNSVHPALAARQMGWGQQVPLLCAQEIDVPGGMPKVVRVLVHWNTETPQQDVKHVYLGKTIRLRPDLHIGPNTLKPLASSLAA